MRIIVINAKSDFSSTQLEKLSSIAETVFTESNPNFSDSVFSDEEEKIVAIGPEVVDWKISNEDLGKIVNLRAVCLPTTSYAWVDGEYLRTKNIPLTNVPQYSTESVAEYAIWLMLGLAKRIPLIAKNQWTLNYESHLGNEVKGKTMGVIGLGAIGSRIAEIGQSMGMKVIYWSRGARDDRFEYQELDSLLTNSDFIFPTLAKNKDTANILSETKLNLIKPNAHLVSITGDELFDLNYALQMVESGKLSGIAFEAEGKKMEEYKGNVLVTPPIAWYTKEALVEDMRIWIESISACADKNPINLVN